MAWCAGMLSGNLATCPNMALRPLVIWSDTGARPVRKETSELRTRHETESLGHRVNGSFGSSFTSGSPGHYFDPVSPCLTRVFPVFEKAQYKDIKIYIFVKIGPTVIEILTFNT